jgi:hypothetical protein
VKLEALLGGAGAVRGSPVGGQGGPALSEGQKKGVLRGDRGCRSWVAVRRRRLLACRFHA